MIVGRWTFVAAAAMLVGISACKDKSNPLGPSDIVFPFSNVSYSAQVQPLFNQACAFTGCHNSTDRAGTLDLTSYGSLVGTPGVVLPGKADVSTLWLRVAGASGLPRMPPGATPLNDNQINGIRTWIVEGAKDN